MKKKIFGLIIFLIGSWGFTMAQYCPSPVRGQNIGISNLAYGAILISNNLSRLTYDYANTLDRGFRNGDLTRHELFVLESELNRLERRIDRALYDGRLSSSEWTFIQFDIRNLERDMSREWNDDERREG